MKKLNNKGETLIEVVVSAAIFAVLAVGLLSVIMGATGINRAATHVAKEDNVTLATLDTAADTAPGVTVTNVTNSDANNVEITIDSTKDTSGVSTPLSTPIVIKAGGKYKKLTTGQEQIPFTKFQVTDVVN